MDEVDLLKWIARDDFAQYGECYGKTLDALIEKGLAQVHGPNEHQSGFIARGSGMMYRAVSITEAGYQFLKSQEPQP